VICQRASSKPTRFISACLCLLGFLFAAAQVPGTEMTVQAAAEKQEHVVVPMVSGQCPAVHAGDWISLDWNPAFDSTWAVTGVKNVSLSFVGTFPDGVTPNPRIMFALGRGENHRIVPLGNGYYRIESPLSTIVDPGVYQLVDAYANPELLPDYKGEIPRPTVFPTSEHLCITVLSPRHPRGSLSP